MACATSSAMLLLFVLLINLLFIVTATPETGAQKHKGYDDAVNLLDLANWRPSQKIRTSCPYALLGLDHENRRVYYLQFGKWKMVEYAEGPENELEQVRIYLYQMMYKIVHDGKKYARPDDNNHFEEVVVILDWDGLQLEQFVSKEAFRLMLETMRMFNVITNHVEYGYFINVNSLVQTMVNGLKPVLASLSEKLEVYGTIKPYWAPRLLRQIPKDQLPESLGGSADFKPLESSPLNLWN